MSERELKACREAFEKWYLSLDLRDKSYRPEFMRAWDAAWNTRTHDPELVDVIKITRGTFSEWRSMDSGDHYDMIRDAVETLDEALSRMEEKI